jgi:hypothetical protein
VKWVDRPAELPDKSPVEASEVWQGAPVPTTRSQPVHTPAQPAVQATAADPLMEAEF